MTPGLDLRIYTWTGSVPGVPGGDVHIAVGPDGSPWVINSPTTSIRPDQNQTLGGGQSATWPRPRTGKKKKK